MKHHPSMHLTFIRQERSFQSVFRSHCCLSVGMCSCGNVLEVGWSKVLCWLDSYIRFPLSIRFCSLLH
jgi:hypothetical protein